MCPPYYARYADKTSCIFTKTKREQSKQNSFTIRQAIHPNHPAIQSVSRNWSQWRAVCTVHCALNHRRYLIPYKITSTILVISVFVYINVRFTSGTTNKNCCRQFYTQWDTLQRIDQVRFAFKWILTNKKIIYFYVLILIGFKFAIAHSKCIAEADPNQFAHQIQKSSVPILNRKSY